MADAITGTSAASTGKAAQDQKKLADDLNDFMTLLTTQLQHQDPLDPMDATEFTSQLVQFASVEQQISANSNLEALLKAQENSQLASVAGYVGHLIEAESPTVQVYGGQAEFNYILHEDSESTLITIQDASGRTVLTADGETNVGKHGVVWDGTDLQGNKVTDGTYQLTVVGQNADGEPIDVTTTAIGVVTGVSYAGNEPVLLINNQEIALDKVLTLREEAQSLTEVDSIASSALHAAASAKKANEFAQAAAQSATAADEAAAANPAAQTHADDANEASTEAAAAAVIATEAAEAAKIATSSGEASQAAQLASIKADEALKAAGTASAAANEAQKVVTDAAAEAA